MPQTTLPPGEISAEKRNPSGALIRDLPIAHPHGLPVYATAAPRVVFSYGNGNSCSGRRVACRRFKKIAAGTACLYRKSLTTDNTDVCCRGCVNRLRLCLTRSPFHRRRLIHLPSHSGERLNIYARALRIIRAALRKSRSGPLQTGTLYRSL